MSITNVPLEILFRATWETIYMVFLSGSISIFSGTLIGIGLFISHAKKNVLQKSTHHIIASVVNIVRSIPFIILMISMLPLTRWIVGTSIGTDAAIVPLTLAAIPFFARLAENAFSEIPVGIIEAAQAMGMNTTQFIVNVLIPESLPTLIRGGTLTLIALIGYSAMAGTVGGGGLGELAINYGYQRFDVWITLQTVLILVVLVQLLQWSGDYFAKKRCLMPLLWIALFGLFLCISGRLYFTDENTTPLILRVGIMSGWPETVMAVAQKEAQTQHHVKIDLITFNDYVLPNTALAHGDIDANIFQHLPYLNSQTNTHQYALVAVAKTFVYPMGFYSQKIKNIATLPPKAIVALPNDVSNQARALLLLQKMGLIRLKTEANVNASLNDVVYNPKNLQFKLLDAAQLPRAMQDSTLVALTNDYVSTAGFTLDQALFKESSDSLYANVIVARKSEIHDPRILALIEVMHSQPVLQATEKIFPHGAAIPAWKES